MKRLLLILLCWGVRTTVTGCYIAPYPYYGGGYWGAETSFLLDGVGEDTVATTTDIAMEGIRGGIGERASVMPYFGVHSSSVIALLGVAWVCPFFIAPPAARPPTPVALDVHFVNPVPVPFRLANM